jgi:hypothetical protein
VSPARADTPVAAPPAPEDLPERLRAPERLPSLTALRESAAYILACQEPSGAIPWEAGRHTDVWDHVECAMALNVVGLYAAADAAYNWMRTSQRLDGTWPIEQVEGEVKDAGADTNQCAYIAVGIWHHWLVREDRAFVERLWPTVRAALDFAVRLQLPSGGIAWAMGAFGGVLESALVAGSSSIWHALDCGLRLAELVGEDVPHWRLAQERLGEALREHEADFQENRRFSMDWYYPVLAGVLRGEAAWARIRERWDEFVVPGLGIRCVDDHPWVTGAETCELALALEGLGDKEGATRLVLEMQHLRDEDGAYHTGYVYPDDAHWPIERSTWTAAAVILAVDAIEEHTGGAGIFRF